MTVRSSDETMTGHIATYSGVVFEPLNPDPSLIAIEDIAHALGNSCRFTGHVRRFYSVAQHSVMCADLVSPELRLTALLHDGSEAYLSDIARPIKMQPEFGDVYKKFEARLEEAIAERFGLVYPYPAEVKWADNVMLRTEQRDLMPPAFRHEGEDYYPGTIEPWAPDAAGAAFLHRFYELTA
jgi:hypothetical protein